MRDNGAESSNHVLTLIGSDGHERQASTLRGETLAATLRREGIPLDFDCGGRGKCGRCSVLLVDNNGVSSTRLACQVSADTVRSVDVSRLLTSSRDLASPDLASSRASVVASSKGGERLGLAVDVGTTTLAAALVELETGSTVEVASLRNPQVAYGRDVLSRVAAASSEGVEVLRRVVCEGVGELATNLTTRVGRSTRDILEIVVAGNTVMEFLLTGRDPSPLGEAPFIVGERRFLPTLASEYPWRVEFSSGARVRVFPVFTAFVGGDIVAGFSRLRRLGLFDETSSRLLLDVGTNGESILAHRGRYYATSTAAGPAFEGSEISQGSLATLGAISGIDYDASRGEWEARVIGDVAARSVCGSGLVDALSGALEFELIGSSGRIASSADYLGMVGRSKIASRLASSGRVRRILISSPEEVDATGGVWLTQGDVRHAQLALGAMKAGRRLLLAAAGANSSELETLYLAGAFGASLSVESSRRVGLTPWGLDSSKVVSCGNLSLLGAVDALVGAVEWDELDGLLDIVEHVELSEREDFAEVFAESTRFPDASK